MSPKSKGRPTPSTVRFAHRSMRGKPAQPAPLDAAPAPAAPTVVALHDLTRFPAPAAWGAGATPPTASPPAWGPAATRRRSATCRRLPCGCPLGADAPPVAAGSSALAPRHVLRPRRGSPVSLGCRPATARLWLATAMARTVARPCEVSRLGCRDGRPRRRGGAFRRPSPSPTHLATFTQSAQAARAVGTLCAPSSGPFGLRLR